MADLTDAVKRHLKITWVSDETTAEVGDIMDRAEPMLNDMIGKDFTYDPEAEDHIRGRDLDLYLNLCLYLYNGLTEAEFIDAYREPIFLARQKYVDPIDPDTEETDEDG